MCGKFTARASWTELVDLAWARNSADIAGGNDLPRSYRVMGPVPVIVCDPESGKRRVVPMRWGFPDPADPRRPRPIHARGETVDSLPSFAGAFHDGQRGIVLVETFNEAPDLGDKSGPQHVITPGEPSGIAFVWRRFEALADPACVMVTAPANTLIATLPTDRMPAVLAPQDWSIWLGETDASAAEVKACLKTVEDLRWTMSPEERAKTAKRSRPTVSDPGGLF